MAVGVRVELGELSASPIPLYGFSCSSLAIFRIIILDNRGDSDVTAVSSIASTLRSQSGSKQPLNRLPTRLQVALVVCDSHNFTGT